MTTEPMAPASSAATAQPGTPPSGYVVRRPTIDDAKAVYDLIAAADVADYGDTDITVDEIEQEFRRIDPQLDAWIVSPADAGDDNGALAGAAMVNDRARALYEAWVITHPGHTGRGISSHLLDLVEARTAEQIDLAPEGVRVALGTYAAVVNQPAIRLLESRGYAESRRYWRMSIEMSGPPEPPVWPDGITVRTYVPGQDDRAIFEASDEAFSDHWGHVRPEFEKWMLRTSGESFDPGTWYFAMDGDEIAGFSLCNAITDMGWVETLGVRRQWRNRGLGLALLRHSFVELYRRGKKSVGLGVDSQNLTGAVRLYEKAGMKADREWVRFEKELRPGREIATTSL